MKKDFLDSLNVKSPCGESWDEMTGGDQIRFCSHCAKDVHDLSAMTRARAERLVRNSNGKLCVRYAKTPQGKLITAPPKFTQITRRVRVAAGVFAASLALSAIAYAQGEPVKTSGNWTQTVKKLSKIGESGKDFSTISGTVMDGNEAVVAEAKVTLRDINNQRVRFTLTDDEGGYKFTKVEPDVYTIEIERIGFKKLVIENINVMENLELEQTAILEVGEVMGVLVIADEPESNRSVQQQEIVELPKNPLTIATMGLIPSACPEEKPKTEKTKKKKK